jgi:hypothetical protein
VNWRKEKVLTPTVRPPNIHTEPNSSDRQIQQQSIKAVKIRQVSYKTVFTEVCSSRGGFVSNQLKVPSEKPWKSSLIPGFFLCLF